MSTPGARITQCDQCTFSFCSNHTHACAGIAPPIHGYLSAVCTSCTRPYVLPTQGPWGAEQAELLELHTSEKLFRSRTDRRAGRSYQKLSGTGVQVLFDINWYATGVITDTDCPCCGAPASLAVDFMDGQACPECKTGRLLCQPVLI